MKQMTPEQKLTNQGWQRQMTYDEPRLSEMVEMYKEIGLEVHIEPFHPDPHKDCNECMQHAPGLYKTIYTRRKDQTDQIRNNH
jgi:hypothetical protein